MISEGQLQEMEAEATPDPELIEARYLAEHVRALVAEVRRLRELVLSPEWNHVERDRLRRIEEAARAAADQYHQLRRDRDAVEVGFLDRVFFPLNEALVSENAPR